MRDMSLAPDYPRLRLDRARELLQELKLEVQEFERRRPYSSREERHSADGFYAWYLELHESPPLRLSSIMGNTIHNLRSALDNLVWELCRRPTDRSNRIYFPIHEK